MDECDFDGCGRSCRPRNKPWVHTHEWGQCEWAVKPAEKPPTLGRWEVYLAEDGENAIHWVETPVETRVEYGFRFDDGEFRHDHWSTELTREAALAAVAEDPFVVAISRLVYIGPTEEITGGSNGS